MTGQEEIVMILLHQFYGTGKKDHMIPRIALFYCNSAEKGEISENNLNWLNISIWLANHNQPGEISAILSLVLWCHKHVHPPTTNSNSHMK